jgi:hypothetical protein
MIKANMQEMEISENYFWCSLSFSRALLVFHFEITIRYLSNILVGGQVSSIS